jgi:hypothetical protein
MIARLILKSGANWTEECGMSLSIYEEGKLRSAPIARLNQDMTTTKLSHVLLNPVVSNKLLRSKVLKKLNSMYHYICMCQSKWIVYFDFSIAICERTTRLRVESLAAIVIFTLRGGSPYHRYSEKSNLIHVNRLVISQSYLSLLPVNQRSPFFFDFSVSLLLD